MSRPSNMRGGELLVRLEAQASEARFVDKSRAELLSKLGIETISDLLYHIPFRYIDLRVKSKIRQAPLGEGAYVGMIRDVTVKRPRPRLNVTEITLADDSGAMVLVWFNQPWISKSYAVGERVLVSGNVTFDYGMKKIQNPFIEKVDETEPLKPIIPVYPTTEGLSQGWLRKIIAAALNDFGRVPDFVPFTILNQHHLPSLSWALRHIHYPVDLNHTEAARTRLAYEELLIFELAIAKRKQQDLVVNPGRVHKPRGTFYQKLTENLDFELSIEQKNAVAEISQDMASTARMQRILIGDVGTGKTVVALHALAIAADSGVQAALMAPTEVLANQYAKKAIPLLEKIGIKAAFLTGSTPAAKRLEILKGLKSGEYSILMGTHALIEPDVEFKDLGLVVIDEQHRFGVRQRAALTDKGKGVDLLTMTATPIPRSLAQTAYGEMDASYIRTRPIQGAGFDTKVLKFHQLHQAHEAVKAAAARGEQAYVVTALIDESDALEAQAAIKVAEKLQENEYSDLKVGLLTGKMRPAEKLEAMNFFERGEFDVLVSTTVIEVGVDVPKATVMIVLNAERFGVAQLHQLRGRVGRGKLRGKVFLVSDSFTSEAKNRFAMLSSTDDGFKLAEFDLQVRGAGELLGTKQSGLISFKIADIVKDAELVSASREDSQEIIKNVTSSEWGLLAIKVEKKLDFFERWSNA